MSITGTWAARMKTPIGSVDAVFTFTEIGGELHGSATGRGEVVEMRDLTASSQPDGSTALTWSQTVTKPMRLNLDFEVTIVGDTLSGFSRAGRLPKSSVEGARG